MTFTIEELKAIIDSVKMRDTANEYFMSKLELLHRTNTRFYAARVKKRKIYRSIINRCSERRLELMFPDHKKVPSVSSGLK